MFPKPPGGFFEDLVGRIVHFVESCFVVKQGLEFALEHRSVSRVGYDGAMAAFAAWAVGVRCGSGAAGEGGDVEDGCWQVAALLACWV